MNNYVKGAIMALLLKEVTRVPTSKLWYVRIGEKTIGFIHSDRKGHYVATTSTGYEYDNCNSFMKALSMFISRAIDSIDKQGEEYENSGNIFTLVDMNIYFTIEHAQYDNADNIIYLVCMCDDGKQMCITPFELVFQILMGYIETE